MRVKHGEVVRYPRLQDLHVLQRLPESRRICRISLGALQQTGPS